MKNTEALDDSDKAMAQNFRRKLELMQRYKLEIVKTLHDAGADLLLGTDALDQNVPPVPGFSIHKELALLVKVCERASKDPDMRA